MTSPQQFAKLLQTASPFKTSPPLANVTFFTGAGFSKSWDDRFPVGDALFSFSYKEWSKQGDILRQLLSLNNHSSDVDLSSSMFKDVVYQIGMMRKYSAIRSRYIDDHNLNMVEKHLRYLVLKKFEATAPIYREENQKLIFDTPLKPHQRDILKLFRLTRQLGDGSSGLPEGLRFHFLSTNYDHTIEAILDNCLAPDDSFSTYTYRGITPVKYCNHPEHTQVFDHWNVSNLLKINGGFEIFKCADGFEIDYSDERTDEELRAEPPQLMLPSREQDYTQHYFQAMFPKVIRLLQESKVLVLVGYSLPEEDALLRLIIKQFAEDRADGARKILFYVDICSKEEQIAKVRNIFAHADKESGLLVIPYSGSFSAWCKKVHSEYVKLS